MKTLLLNMTVFNVITILLLYHIAEDQLGFHESNSDTVDL